jgi:branched-chain amino acid transport system substrate-binding protein
MLFLRSTLIGFCIASASWACHAQIKIGQSTGVTGAIAATVKETSLGSQLYLDSINARGGIAGQKIELITLDDKFDPKLTATNALELIEKEGVVALFMTRGTPHNEGIIPILDKHSVPLLAPSTGAMVLHQPVKKHVFNVRATYQREAERVITHLVATGVKKIGVIHVDDSFGFDGLVGTQKGFAAARMGAVGVFKFDRSKPDFAQIAPEMVKLEPKAIVIIGSGTAAAEAIKALKAAGSLAQFATLSNNASSGFIKLLGDHASGVIVSQVLPQSLSYGVVQEAATLAKVNGISEISPALLEGFTGAKVLVEALRRAGPNPTRQKLQAALESMHKFDLGGLKLNFSTTDHTGLDFVDLSIISAAGKFRR